MILLLTILMLTGCAEQTNLPNKTQLLPPPPQLAETSQKEAEEMQIYYFPAEEEEHEGTWLTWPHHYSYGMEYRLEIEDIWIQMAFALHKGEKVHIIAYNKDEQSRIMKLLEAEGLDMSRVDFVIAKSDDVWSRDTGRCLSLTMTITC